MVWETRVQSLVESYQRLKKWYLMLPCLTQHYKVCIKGKVEQSRERSSALSLDITVVAIERGAFGSPSTMVANFTLLIANLGYQISKDGSSPDTNLIKKVSDISTALWRCLWCNGYRRRKWTWRHEFKPWTSLIACHIALIPLGKVWIILPPAMGK